MTHHIDIAKTNACIIGGGIAGLSLLHRARHFQGWVEGDALS